MNKIGIIIPVKNDWPALLVLLKRIDTSLNDAMLQAKVVVIDDGSSKKPETLTEQLRSIKDISIVRLRRNVGHQRAIAIGIAYCSQHLNQIPIVIMDGDGEDAAEDIPRLINTMNETAGEEKIVFAERYRRSESIVFKFFYMIYKLTHWLLTSRGIRFGNFSVIPPARIQQLAIVSELWNHYAAAVVKSGIPYVMVPTRRRERISGKSSMNFVSLVIHGFSALSVFADEIATRLLIISGVLVGLCAGCACAVVGIKIFSTLAVPGWATYILAFLIVIILQVIAACFLGIFLILGLRNQLSFIPERDYSLFIAEIVQYPGTVSVIDTGNKG